MVVLILLWNWNQAQSIEMFWRGRSILQKQNRRQKKSETPCRLFLQIKGFSFRKGLITKDLEAASSFAGSWQSWDYKHKVYACFFSGAFFWGMAISPVRLTVNCNHKNKSKHLYACHMADMVLSLHPIPHLQWWCSWSGLTRYGPEPASDPMLTMLWAMKPMIGFCRRGGEG